MKKFKKFLQKMMNHHQGNLIPSLGVWSILLVVMLIISIFILSIVNVRMSLGRYTDEVLRCAEVNGDVNSLEVITRMDELRYSTLNVNPSDVSFEGTDYMTNAADGRVQLNNRIMVTATYDYSMTLGSWWHMRIHLKATSDGLSETYWK